MNTAIKVLGNKLDSFRDYRDLYNYLFPKLKTYGFKGYITVNNVHTMMEGYRDLKFQSIINNSLLSIPDGKPLEIVGRLKGDKKISRLFGPSIMETFIDWGRADGLTHFFLGSSEKTLSKLRSSIELKYPGTKISGMIAPPYKPVSEWDNEYFIHEINKLKPDLIWIGLGAPKQEHWMFDNIEKLDKGVMFGIGAGFDYLAGHTKHAPEWMKNASLEWLYRLIQEPKRLWKRYFTTIPPFLLLIALELIGFKVNRS